MEAIVNSFYEILQRYGLILEIVATSFAIVKAVQYYRNQFIKRKIKTWTGKQTEKYFIETRGQNIDPCENDEIKDASEYSMTERLIPFFINKVFKNEIDNQYYIILGDSGMGKTTFIIHLFNKYSKKILKKYDIEIISLYHSSCIDAIDNIVLQYRTILLLDGFDENEMAMKDYKFFMEELLTHTENFPKVVITCRTQFFPNQQFEPYETGKIQFNTYQKKNVFYKIYMSPFNDKEINQYISKKYPFFWKKSKRTSAKSIIGKCPYLMARPMLLGKLDELINDNVNYEYTFQIYERLVINWLHRENVEYKKLVRFTERTAITMYKKGTIYLSSEEINDICKNYGIKIYLIDAKSKSLLNRNGNGDYKFAHKSIYEFILAKKAFINKKFRISCDFTNLDMAKEFLREMQEQYIKKVFDKKNISEDLSCFEIKNKNFENYSLINCSLIKTKFIKCIFKKCVFKENLFNDCQFISCFFDEVDMEKEILPKTIFNNCEIINSKLNYINSSYCIFENINISNSSFCNANIYFGKFIFAQIFSCNFAFATLMDCEIENMTGASNKCEEINTDIQTLENLEHKNPIDNYFDIISKIFSK